jgi:hypothetical protein
MVEILIDVKLKISTILLIFKSLRYFQCFLLVKMRTVKRIKNNLFQLFGNYTTMGFTRSTDMRIVSLGSGSAFLDLEWFFNYDDIQKF